jgi:multidrug efflux pump subunit AcrB
MPCAVESEKISSGLPLGVSLEKITDQAVNISSAVNEFMVKFAMAVFVVLLVSLLSLGWRVGIVVVAAIPLTLGAVFVIMMVTDRVFDRITLGALIISLGLLVDDAIIAIESMVVKMQEGIDRIQAVAYAWSHTAAPMLAGTLVTVIGFLPVGFARSTAGEYAGNIFWIVGFSLIASWIVAVVFTPVSGRKLLPEIKTVKGGHAGIYSTPGYQRLRHFITWCVKKKYTVAGIVVGAFLMAGGGMAVVKKQFFQTLTGLNCWLSSASIGTSIETTSAAAKKIEHWLSQQPESKIVTSYIGAGAPRFFFSYNPELPDPSFAKIVVLTPNAKARDHLKLRLRQAAADGLAPEARIRATQLVFGPYSPFPVAFRVMGN